MTWNGRSWLVAGFTSLAPRVLNGSKGALYYPPSEIGKNPGAWNGIPLTLGHPADPITNAPQSGRQQDVLERLQLGFVFNDSFNRGRRQGEAWFDEEWTRNRAPEVHSALLKNEAIELSTGLYTDNIEQPGIAPTGQPYDAIAVNYRPDHLAVLVGQRGACSVSDGCGINVTNEEQEVPSWFVRIFQRVLNQGRHADTGQFVPKAGVSAKQLQAAAERGWGHVTGHEQAPPGDPDDDGDASGKVVGQGDRDEETWKEELAENAATEEVPMVLTEKQRAEAVGYLVANCDCYKGKEKLLANREAFSDDEIVKLVDGYKRAKQNEAIANAARKGVQIGDRVLTFNAEGKPCMNEKDDETNADESGGGKVQADGEEKQESAKDATKKPPIANSFTENDLDALSRRMFGKPLAEVREIVSNGDVSGEKDRLIAQLVANVRDDSVKQRLIANHRKKPVQQLRDEVAQLPVVLRQPAVYGAPVQYNEPVDNAGDADLLTLPEMGWTK